MHKNTTQWITHLIAGVALLVFCAACYADDHSSVLVTVSASSVTATLYPKKYCPEPQSELTIQTGATNPIDAESIKEEYFALHNDDAGLSAQSSYGSGSSFIENAKRLKGLPIVSFVKTDNKDVFFGISKKGGVGIHMNLRGITDRNF